MKRAAIVVVLALSACGGRDASVPTADEVAWLGGSPEAWGIADQRKVRSDPAYAEIFDARAADPEWLFSVGDGPCRAELAQADAVHASVRRAQSLKVFAGASEAARCFARVVSREVGGAFEVPSDGASRAFVFPNEHGATVALASGDAVARARAALASGRPPTVGTLPKGAVVQVVSTEAGLVLIGAKLPPATFLNLSGLERVEVTLTERNALEAGPVPFAMRFSFSVAAQADHLEAKLVLLAEKLRQRGQFIEVARINSWTFLSRGKWSGAPLASDVRAAAEALPLR